MNARALAVVVLVAAGVLLLADPASAGSQDKPLKIDHQEEIPGADTFMFSIHLDESAGDPSNFNIANGSYFKVKGYYPVGVPDAPRQDAAGVRGVVQGHSQLFCPPRESNNADPCFMDASGVSIKDSWDARVETGAFTFEHDPDVFGWGSATGVIAWEEARRFEIPIGEDEVTYRFFISIPGAKALEVDIHIHSPHDITIHNTSSHDGGLMATGEDFDPTVGADTMAASAMVGGQETVPLETSGDRFYAAFGPSWNGVSTAGFVALRHNTAALSSISYEGPNGASVGGTAIGVGSWSGILLPGSNDLGTHTFSVDRHVGVGPQDLYLVGFKGPTS